ncbi:MAG: GGDEF domain-containing protein [Lachnospiraceae bacterium]|nr:GGDEF domain-containing protein [Lachnospiraceae bacterium]
MKRTGEKQFVQAFIGTANLALLLIHICLLLFFLWLHLWFMVVVNVFSVSIYGAMLPISRKKVYLFLVVTIFEIWIQMALAVICSGWEMGFQVYSFALLPVIFYGDYVGSRLQKKTINPIILSIMVVMSYGGLRVYTWCYDVHFVDNSFLEMGASFLNAVFMLVFLIIFHANYERLMIQTDHVASKDQLTGLNNRHSMRNIIQTVLDVQNGEEKMAFAMADIDNFKEVNDTYGHKAGDLVLQGVASKIEGIQNKDISVCRWGGEEFLIMARGEECFALLKESMDIVLSQVRDMVVDYGQHPIQVTITAGLAGKQAQETVDEAIRRADEYLYQGKVSGKDQLVYQDEIV